MIVAPATADGRSALAVVRMSGPGARAIADAVCRLRRPAGWTPGRVRRVDLVDRDGVFDDGLATWFRAPRSYTGEDLVEVALHGNPELVARLLSACVDAGARIAVPGEFTRRAVLNGRLDLVRAEAVDQVIRASGPAGLRVARDGLAGRLGAEFARVREALIAVVAELEARLDWPDDDLALESDERLRGELARIEARCRELAETHRAGRLRIEGATVALLGPVNAGKSSLFNRLVGEERAIVHDSPGTTRDLVEARVRWGSVDVRLLDTAGDRDTSDPVEAIGVARARAVEADLALVVLRCRPGGPDPAERSVLERTRDRDRIVVTNAVDLPGDPEPRSLPVSARTGEGLDALRAAILDRLGGDLDGLVIASERQRDRLLGIARACAIATGAWDDAGIAVSADALTAGLRELDALTGADTAEDVLDAVFARFCIGK